jgi:mannose-1-phosphate guanylyltransferase/mannose-6-phosphate isomerase
LAGDSTLLEATIKRVEPVVQKSDMVVVTSQQTAKGEGYRALQGLDCIFEPAARNTAAAIGAAATYFVSQKIDPILVVLPSDHLIRDEDAFRQGLLRAVEAARGGALVTFGIRPTRPATGFGYIEAKGTRDPRQVTAFHEKPDPSRAHHFVNSGHHYWNSGIFVWRASTILAEIRKAVPPLGLVLSAIERDARDIGFDDAMKRHFAAAPSVSIDKGVLEYSNKIVMIPAPFDWSDLGSWDAVYEATEKDRKGNASQGNVIAVDCSNVMTRAESRLVAAVGLQDISIVETSDAVLVAGHGASEAVRIVVDELSRRSAPQREAHLTVRRPWGSYTVLEEGPAFKLKRIEVNPGGRLSLQRHRQRSEHWVVIAGEATVTSGTVTSTLKANESTFIPIGALHRLENLGSEPLHIIEVQVGSYLGEDDIERLDDQYGRVPEH